MASNIQAKSTLDGLPKPFLLSLRTLFDILDENQTGSVNFSEIANAWENEPVDGLPHGIVDALKKVTPPSGLLSFERFVAGLKIALLRKQAEPSLTGNSKNILNNPSLSGSKPDLLADTQYSNDDYHKKQLQVNSNASERFRTKSMPQLAWENEQTYQAKNTHAETSYTWKSHPLLLDGKIPNSYQFDKSNEYRVTGRRPGDGRSSIATASALYNNKYGATNDVVDPEVTQSPSKRREPRRHTLSSGVDYHMIRRIKLLEQERDILLQGYETVQQAGEWYEYQLAEVDQKQKYIGQTPSQGDYSVESHQERVNFQTARILEVNQQLRALIDSSRKGFPFHMHLAVSQSTMQRHDTDRENVIAMLKAQNKMLTKEVSTKSENISQLEREKAQLIKELFQSRNANPYAFDDTTFI